MTTKIGKKLDLDTFSYFVDFCEKNDWIKNRREALGVLQNECKSKEEVSALLHLLNDLTVMNDELLQKSSDWMAKTIAENPQNNPNSHVIIPNDFDDRQGSSNAIYEKLRTVIIQYKYWDGSKILRKKIRDVTDDPNVKSITLIDDFLGTREKVEKLTNFIHNKNKNIDIDIVTCVGMKIGLDKTYPHYVRSVSCYKTIQRSISDNVNSHLQKSYKKAIKDLSLAVGNIKNKNAMGRKKSEACYGALNWNTPNNTFPIFYRGKNINSKTLFHRAPK